MPWWPDMEIAQTPGPGISKGTLSILISFPEILVGWLTQQAHERGSLSYFPLHLQCLAWGLASGT